MLSIKKFGGFSLLALPLILLFHSKAFIHCASSSPSTATNTTTEPLSNHVEIVGLMREILKMSVTDFEAKLMDPDSQERFLPLLESTEEQKTQAFSTFTTKEQQRLELFWDLFVATMQTVASHRRSAQFDQEGARIQAQVLERLGETERLQEQHQQEIKSILNAGEQARQSFEAEQKRQEQAYQAMTQNLNTSMDDTFANIRTNLRASRDSDLKRLQEQVEQDRKFQANTQRLNQIIEQRDPQLSSSSSRRDVEERRNSGEITEPSDTGSKFSIVVIVLLAAAVILPITIFFLRRNRNNNDQEHYSQPHPYYHQQAPFQQQQQHTQPFQPVYQQPSPMFPATH